MKISVKEKGVCEKLALVSASVSVIGFVAFLIYGLVYSVYFDAAVLLCIALGAAGMAAYSLIPGSRSGIFGPAGILLLSFGLGLFFLNSYPVWADWYGDFNMYGSQGTITPVIIILVILLAAVLSGIISCFMRKEVQ